MKYRKLTVDELKDMEADFIRFLAANTITADDWVKTKKENQEKADSLIDMYSDIVFDKVLKDAQYLEFRSPKDLKIFECNENIIKLRGITIQGSTDYDFVSAKKPKNWINQLLAQETNIKVYKAEKGYSIAREQELFQMMEKGCLISKEEKLFKTLESLDQGA